VSRQGYAPRPRAGTDANGMTAEDREAVRNHRTRVLGGGLISKRYRQDMSDITNSAPETKTPAPANDK